MANNEYNKKRGSNPLQVEVPTTLYDGLGRVLGVANPDGTFLVPALTTVGNRVTVEDSLHDQLEMEIVWDGCNKLEGSETKGELLGDYSLGKHTSSDRGRRVLPKPPFVSDQREDN